MNESENWRRGLAPVRLSRQRPLLHSDNSYRIAGPCNSGDPLNARRLWCGSLDLRSEYQLVRRLRLAGP